MISNMIGEKFKNNLIKAFILLSNHQHPLIRIIAYNNKGSHVFSSYGLLTSIDDRYLYFSYKKAIKGNGPIEDDEKNPDKEFYIKREYIYELVLEPDFTIDDYNNLINIIETPQSMVPLELIYFFKRFTNKLYNESLLLN